MGVNEPFKNVSCQERIQNFFQEFSSFFSSAFFPADLILSNFSAKKDSRGSEGMLPRKILENLQTAMAILVLFQQFLRKVCHNFGP